MRLSEFRYWGIKQDKTGENNEKHKHTKVFSDIYPISHQSYDQLFYKDRHINHEMKYGVQFFFSYDPEPVFESDKKTIKEYGGLYLILRNEYNTIESITCLSSYPEEDLLYNNLIRMIQ